MGLQFADIGRLFRERGHIEYNGEGVSQLEHSLQCALLAEREGAPDTLLTAAFLHDLGHLLNPQGETPTARGIDDQHQYFAIPFIRPLFPLEVVEPIRLHVDAKRALCRLEPGYYEALSADAKRSLALQGGPYALAEAATFVARPYARDAMRLRRWDDRAKTPGAATPPLEHYLAVAARLSTSA